ncbi:MAG: DUF2730 family protein [Rhodospirillales bacterium]|jgi:hypothetical protein|nr:DUF2730 family protein [Rhodospirillales bacterium]
MSWEAAKFILELVALAGAFLAWFYAWQAARAKASRADVDRLRDEHGNRLTSHGERITRVEGRLEAMPTREDINKLHGRVTALGESVGKVASDVSAIGATVAAINRQVGLLTEHHMHGSGK